MQTIAIVNKSTVMPDADVRAAALALQIQVDRDFGPAWGASAAIDFVPTNGQPVSPAEWQLVVLDNSDQAGALGYHDWKGAPIGFSFAATDDKYGLSRTVTLSHELLEMLADPFIDSLCAVYSNNQGTAFDCYAREVCDAVEDDSLGYEINGVKVSNFVLPSYFMPGASGPFDFKGALKAGCPSLATGGYIGKLTPGQGWTQVTAANSKRAAARFERSAFTRSARRFPPI